MRGAGVADGGCEVVAHRGLRCAELAADAAHGAGVHAGDDEAVDLVGRRARRSSAPRSTPARRAGRTSPRRSALPTHGNAVEPGARQRSMNSSVAVRAAEVLGDDRAVGVGSPTSIAAAPSPPCDSSALRGQAVADVGRRPRARSRCRRARCAARRCPIAARRRSRARPPASRAGARRGWPTRCSCRGTPGWRSRTTARRARRLGRRARGPGGRPRRPWWWCPRRRRRPTGCPCLRRSRRSWRCRRGRAGGTGRSRLR